MLTNCDGVGEAQLGRYEFDEQSTRLLFTFPAGFIIQDIPRIGVRVTPALTGQRVGPDGQRGLPPTPSSP